MTDLLTRIDKPQDLHGLTDEELQQVAQEVREHIIDTVGEIGGHFGANLGACEIAVALHSMLDSPRDKILWDVGHQAYPHKVLTGRRDRCRRSASTRGWRRSARSHESEHDIMGAGHASTAIGYAVGIKEAMRRGHGEDGHVVAVVGDGALTGGVAFEAVHQAGGEGTPIVVVLNDNGMSIAPNVGALSRYFNRIRLNPKLWHAREGFEGGLTKLPVGIGAAFERFGPHVKESIKAFWAPGTVVGGARLRLHRRDRRPRRTRAPARAARGAGRAEPARGRPLRDRQGQGLRAGRGGRARGDGEVARRQAQVDRERRPRPAPAPTAPSGAPKPTPPQYTQVFGRGARRASAGATSA